MPENGAVNDRFGVYQNVCCGLQIMVREKAKFPDCKNHPNLTTIWKRVDTDKEAEEKPSQSNRRSA
jgi:hypothetical protein